MHERSYNGVVYSGIERRRQSRVNTAVSRVPAYMTIGKIAGRLLLASARYLYRASLIHGMHRWLRLKNIQAKRECYFEYKNHWKEYQWGTSPNGKMQRGSCAASPRKNA